MRLVICYTIWWGQWFTVCHEFNHQWEWTKSCTDCGVFETPYTLQWLISEVRQSMWGHWNSCIWVCFCTISWFIIGHKDLDCLLFHWWESNDELYHLCWGLDGILWRQIRKQEPTYHNRSLTEYWWLRKGLFHRHFGFFDHNNANFLCWWSYHCLQ